jgi:hypothetical protein
MNECVSDQLRSDQQHILTRRIIQTLPHVPLQ